MFLVIGLARFLYSHLKDLKRDNANVGRFAMLRDGLYQVAYGPPGSAPAASDFALASVRDGRIMGSDPHGGIYRGTKGRQRQLSSSAAVELICIIPPGGELVTGLAAGTGGATVKIIGTIDPAAATQTAMLHVAGQPVIVEISYLNPLPT